ncbi:hypothetical protein ACJJTC_012285 [Scirpophaga incertulas]
MDESLILDINEGDDNSKRHLKQRVSNVLRTDTASKTKGISKLDQLSAARLELVKLQMETAKKEQQFIEEQHKLKMLHLANDERRKEEIHASAYTQTTLWTCVK